MIRNILHAIREERHVIVEGDGSASLVELMKSLGMLPEGVRVKKIFLRTSPKYIKRVLEVRGEKPDINRIIERLEKDASRYERLAKRRDMNEFLRYVYRKEAEKNRVIAAHLKEGRAPHVGGYDLYLDVKHEPRIMENAADLIKEAVRSIIEER